MTIDNKLELLHRVLETSGQTIAVAESLTSGHIQALIGSVSGASNVFNGGITAYVLEQKVNHLGVDRDHAKSVNCVSQRVAQEMALGVRQLFNASIGLATTGYAEPNPDNNIMTPFAYIGVNIHDRSKVWCVECKEGSRLDVQMQVAKQAIREMIAELEALSAEKDLDSDLNLLASAYLNIQRDS